MPFFHLKYVRDHKIDVAAVLLKNKIFAPNDVPIMLSQHG